MNKYILDIIAAAPLALGMAGCGAGHPAAAALWGRGDVVCIRLTAEAGMVAGTPQWGGISWGYPTRLARSSVTSSGLLGPTVRTDESYAIIVFREYELEDCEVTK